MENIDPRTRQHLENKLLEVLDNELQKYLKFSTGQMAELTEGMAHVLLNPLTTSKGFLQLIEQKAAEKTLTPEQVTNFPSIVINELNKINQLVKDFVFATNYQPSKMENHNLNMLILEVIQEEYPIYTGKWY